MLRITTVTEFFGTPTTAKERELLRQAGFVHILGLQTYDEQGRRGYVVGAKLTSAEHGKFDIFDDKMVIVTLGGEVWISVTHVTRSSPIPYELAPYGQGAFVPFSDGETVDQHALLQRVADPSCGLVVVAQ